MIGLVIILISIALLGLLLLLGINNINSDSIRSNGYTEEIKLSTSNVELALNSYKKINGSYPDVNNWKEELYPQYGREPELSFNENIIFTNINNKFFLCLTSNNREDINRSFNQIAAKHSYGYYVSGECGNKDSQIEDSLFLSYELN